MIIKSLIPLSILLILILNKTNGTYIMKSVLGRTSIDLLYSNEDDTDMIDIDPIQQEKKLKEVELNCSIKLTRKSNKTNVCPVAWDSIICWPETFVNHTVNIPCPNYVHKFNRRYKASKYCYFNVTNKAPTWTRTNFSQCLLPSQHLINELEEKKILQKHIRLILVIRFCFFILSLISLIISTIILLREKLRCPRNIVHINLFVAFILRTLTVITVEVLRRESIVFMLPNQTNQTSSMEVVNRDERHNLCRLLMVLFRYTGSVYNVALTTEAIYLMLILKFPYYSEKKGSKFSIIFSWGLPFLWLIPWLCVRLFVESKWCWQLESLWNMLIEIPHTILTLTNLICAFFVVNTLYSKIKKHRISPEKMQKYRRLAKSILIIVPIFGLQFIIFEWLPYVNITSEDSLLELPLIYLEAIFSSIQGFLASIACCFIHKEAQIEFLVVLHNIFKWFKCLNKTPCFKFIDTTYIQRLKYLREMRVKDNEITMDGISESNNFLPKRRTDQNLRLNSHRKTSIDESESCVHRYCCCLFSNQKNDFYELSHRRSTILSTASFSSRFIKRIKSRSTTAASLTAKKNSSGISLKQFRKYSLEERHEKVNPKILERNLNNKIDIKIEQEQVELSEINNNNSKQDKNVNNQLIKNEEIKFVLVND